jgi:hypothetical protein
MKDKLTITVLGFLIISIFLSLFNFTGPPSAYSLIIESVQPGNLNGAPFQIIFSVYLFPLLQILCLLIIFKDKINLPVKLLNIISIVSLLLSVFIVVAAPLVELVGFSILRIPTIFLSLSWLTLVIQQNKENVSKIEFGGKTKDMGFIGMVIVIIVATLPYTQFPGFPSRNWWYMALLGPNGLDTVFFSILFLIPAWMLSFNIEKISKQLTFILTLIGTFIFFYFWYKIISTPHLLPQIGTFLMPIGFLATLWKSFMYYKSE